jgi:enolase
VAIADILNRVRTKARDARKSAHQLAIDVASGKKVSDENIESAVRNAGWSFEEFADLCEKLAARKQAFEEFSAADWDSKLTTLRGEYAQACADEEALRNEIDLLTNQLRTLAGNNRAKAQHIGRVDEQAKEAKDAFKAKFGAATSWTEEPTPHTVTRRSVEGQKINVGWKPQPGSLAAGKTPEGHDTTSKRIDFGPAIDIGLKSGETE